MPLVTRGLEYRDDGATLDGVVVFDDGRSDKRPGVSLATTKRAEPGAVTAKVLVAHGALDPHVPMTDVIAFADEMTRAGANWQVNVYGGAMHGFTHAHAVEGATPGVAYHGETDRRSFAAARAFLAEALSAR
jgi:dienelactone hydrolase